MIWVSSSDSERKLLIGCDRDTCQTSEADQFQSNIQHGDCNTRKAISALSLRSSRPIDLKKEQNQAIKSLFGEKDVMAVAVSW